METGSEQAKFDSQLDTYQVMTLYRQIYIQVGRAGARQLDVRQAEADTCKTDRNKTSRETDASRQTDKQAGRNEINRQTQKANS